MSEDIVNIITQNITNCAKANDYRITANITRIAKAKARFFGVDKWNRCPCYPPDDTEHGCGSVACDKQIKESGICHCNLFTKSFNEDE